MTLLIGLLGSWPAQRSKRPVRGGGIPAGCGSTDSEGGVRIEWVCPTASVHLVVPATSDRKAYIYHEVGDDYATEDATPERLAYWLRQIN